MLPSRFALFGRAVFSKKSNADLNKSMRANGLGIDVICFVATAPSGSLMSLISLSEYGVCRIPIRIRIAPRDDIEGFWHSYFFIAKVLYFLYKMKRKTELSFLPCKDTNKKSNAA